MFASKLNSAAEQRALEAQLRDLLDATEVSGGATGSPLAPAGRMTVPAPPGKPTATGLERARQLAAQAEDYRATVEEPARPNWDQPVLWDGG